MEYSFVVIMTGIIGASTHAQDVLAVFQSDYDANYYIDTYLETGEWPAIFCDKDTINDYTSNVEFNIVCVPYVH